MHVYSSFFLHYTVKYGFMVDDHLSMSIVALVGRVGVWRVTHMEIIDSDQSVLEISEQMEPFHPEEHSFTVVEIYKGVYTLTFN